VVLFNHFGGITNNGDIYRICVHSNSCYRHLFFSPQPGSSSLIQDMSSTYIERFMPSNGYIALMLRFELLLAKLKFDSMSKKDQHSAINNVIHQVVKEVNSLKLAMNISYVFATLDIGKYGSKSLNITNPFLREGVKKYYYSIFKGLVTEKEYCSKCHMLGASRRGQFPIKCSKTI